MPSAWTRRFLDITAEMRPGCASADAAVVHFYAALMRRDGSHLAVLPPKSEWDDVLVRKLEKHDRFYFHGARLHGLACLNSACDFEVRLEVSSKPDSRGSSGVDQSRVEHRGDRWTITLRQPDALRRLHVGRRSKLNCRVIGTTRDITSELHDRAREVAGGASLRCRS